MSYEGAGKPVDAKALELAVTIAGLFIGPSDANAVEDAVEIALAAAMDAIELGAARPLIEAATERLLRPAIVAAVEALIAATRPVRVVIDAPDSVVGTIHD